MIPTDRHRAEGFPMKQTVIALAAAVLAAAALPASAQARCHGCGVAAGVVGGLAAGAILGSALAGPRYVEPAPVYVTPPPPPPPSAVYYDDPYAPVCHIERHRVWFEGYGWRYRRVEVCD
jgi:hypothetical protein